MSSRHNTAVPIVTEKVELCCAKARLPKTKSTAQNSLAIIDKPFFPFPNRPAFVDFARPYREYRLWLVFLACTIWKKNHWAAHLAAQGHEECAPGMRENLNPQRLSSFEG
jgi:hypothetical protein